MSKKVKEIGIHEAYMQDAQKAELELFGRESDESRRGFFKEEFTVSYGGSGWFKYSICKQYAFRVNSSSIGKLR